MGCSRREAARSRAPVRARAAAALTPSSTVPAVCPRGDSSRPGGRPARPPSGRNPCRL